MKCVCCKNFTLRRWKGFWLHRKCETELMKYLLLAKHELPNIRLKLVFGTPKLLESVVLAQYNNQEGKMKRIKRDVSEKAWEILEDKYGTPSWVNK